MAISRLLNQIENKELVLPEFQREFTWNKDQAKKLINSFLKDYPTGALLFWKTREEIALKNMPNFEFDGRVEVILDGQQRLTTLYMLVKDAIPPYYSTRDIGEGKDIRNLYYNLEMGALEYYKKLKMQNNPRWVKVTDCFKADRVDDVEIADQISEKEGVEFKQILKKISDNLDNLQDIKEEEYPIIYVKESSSLQEALTVFDRVNSGGTPLTEADIALAHMCSNWSETRRAFKRKIDELKEEGFSFDLKFFVRAMNAVVNCRAEYDQLHDIPKKKLVEGWKKLTNILDYLINVLKSRAFIYTTSDLNTTNVLIPIIGYLSQKGPEFPTDRILKRTLYWMYASLYQRRFTSSVDQKLEEDLNSVKEEKAIEKLIETLKEETGEPKVTADNLKETGVGHPLYNMVSIVIRKKGGVDWANGIKFSQPFGKKYKVERHHIFPKSVLGQEAGYDTGEIHDRKLVHEISNRVPMTKNTNMDIFTSRPKEYLPKIEEKNPGNLRKFFIPMNEDLWKLENYEAFLQKRRKLITQEINSFMESLLSEATSKLVKKNLSELIDSGESKNLEFKASIRWHLHKEDFDKKLEKPILKTITAFLNTKGGVLLIGVKDDGSIMGIEKDMEWLKNKDKYQLHLTNIISSRIGKGYMPYVKIHFTEESGEQICRVECEGSPEPAYLEVDGEEKFYIRAGNSTRMLSVSEANSYINDHWG